MQLLLFLLLLMLLLMVLFIGAVHHSNVTCGSCGCFSFRGAIQNAPDFSFGRRAIMGGIQVQEASLRGGGIQNGPLRSPLLTGEDGSAFCSVIPESIITCVAESGIRWHSRPLAWARRAMPLHPSFEAIVEGGGSAAKVTRSLQIVPQGSWFCAAANQWDRRVVEFSDKASVAFGA